MNILELRRVIEQLEELYAAAGAAGPAKDLRSVLRMLDGHDSKSVEEFVRETKELLTRAGTARPSIEANANIVEKYSRELLSAGNDFAQLEACLEAADLDPQVRRQEWLAIANAYLNAPTGSTHLYKFKSAKEARAAIRDAFIERIDAERKQGIIKKLTKWAS